MTKTGTIMSVEFKNEYKPANDILYVHIIELDNGDKGNIYKSEKYPQDIAKGAILKYTIAANKNNTGFVIKQVADAPQNEQKSSSQPQQQYKSNGGGYRKAGPKKPDEFLGYACAYAKDLVIAGKTSNTDLIDYKRIADAIYNHIKEKLKEE